MSKKKFLIADRLGGVCKNQSGLFTPGHEKHYLKITITNTETGEQFTRRKTYQYNPTATRFRAGDGVLAVLLDAQSYANTVGFLDFCREFGYSVDSPKARGAFRSCKASYEFFKSAGMSDSEMGQELQDRDQ